jgi:uncharacterized heparinase superfamily protein
MAPMLRFFRLGDGALALFNGGRECDAKMIEDLLARDEVRGQPFALCAAFRLSAARRGTRAGRDGLRHGPKGAFSAQAHAGCLSFEFSAGAQRLVVNCGAPSQAHEKWDGALARHRRAFDRHAGRHLHGHALPAGLARDLIGPRLFGGPTKVITFASRNRPGLVGRGQP